MKWIDFQKEKAIYKQIFGTMKEDVSFSQEVRTF